MRKELGDWVRDSRKARLKDASAEDRGNSAAIDKAANKYKWGAGVKKGLNK